MTYFSCVAVCASRREVLFPRRIVKCESEETFGNLFDRIMAVSRSTVTVVKTEICVSDLSIGLHPVHIVDLDTPINVCQQFGCYNVRFSVLNDQNAACSRTEETSLPDAHALTNSADIVLPSPQLP